MKDDEIRSKEIAPDEPVFLCPHCGADVAEDESVDRCFTAARVQSSDDLSADPKPQMIELWYCLWCGKYFRTYYTLTKITMLIEEEKETPAGEIPSLDTMRELLK